MGQSYEDFNSEDGEYGYFYGESLYKRSPFKDPIIEHLLYEKDVICISSAPGVGKTMLVLQLLCALTSGKPFLGTYKVTRPMNVLYIQSEGDRSETLERLGLMTKGVSIDNSKWAHINLPGAMLNDRDEFNRFVALVKSYHMLYDVIMIDPLYTTVNGSLNNDEVATNWIRHIRELKAHFDCAMIINHHDAKDVYSEGTVIDKGNNISYGSVFWQAFFNHNFKLKVRKEIYTLEGGKQRSGKIIDKIDMILQTEPLMFTCVTDDSAANVFVVRATLERSSTPITAKDLIKLTSIPKATMYRILHKLLENEQIEEISTPQYKLYKVKGAV